MFNSVLLVCVGNICRSPLAEARFRQLAPPSVQVSSAGVQAMVGWPADPQSVHQAQLHGLDVDAHRARQLTAGICSEHDLILVMEDSHVDAVCAICPSARGKVMLLGRWSNNTPIPDPYRKDDSHFAAVWQQIDAFSVQWAKKLQWPTEQR